MEDSCEQVWFATTSEAEKSIAFLRYIKTHRGAKKESLDFCWAQRSAE